MIGGFGAFGRFGLMGASPLAFMSSPTLPPVTGEPRLAEITQAYGSRTIAPPQTYYDRRALKSQDVNITFPSFTHVATKSGLWSDPTVWSAGTVPGNDAVVDVGNYTVTYDVSSNARIWGIRVRGSGTFQRSTLVETRLVVYTVLNYGADFWEDTQPSATTGKARHELLFWFPESPGATAKGGYICAGATRWKGQKKSRRLTMADAAAGATTLTLDRVPENWRVGDSLLIGGMTTPARASSDAQYTGPTSAYLPINNSFGVRTNTYGYAQSHDEVRTIAAIDGATITLNSALTNNHLAYEDEVPLPPSSTATTRLRASRSRAVASATRRLAHEPRQNIRSSAGEPSARRWRDGPQA